MYLPGRTSCILTTLHFTCSCAAVVSLRHYLTMGAKPQEEKMEVDATVTTSAPTPAETRVDPVTALKTGSPTFPRHHTQIKLIACAPL